MGIEEMGPLLFLELCLIFNIWEAPLLGILRFIRAVNFWWLLYKTQENWKCIELICLQACLLESPKSWNVRTRQPWLDCSIFEISNHLICEWLPNVHISKLRIHTF